MTQRTGWAWVTSLLVALVGCGPAETDLGGEAEAVDTAASEIINGEPTSDTGAVAIYWGGGHPCSGVLVAPRRVLTARHCVTDGDLLRTTDPLLPLSALLVTSEPAPGAALPPSSSRRAGYWSTVSAIYDRDSHPTGAAQSMDLAILVLRSQLNNSRGTTLAPASLLYEGANSALLNKLVTAVGYGRAVVGSEQNGGVQRFMRSRVSDVSSGTNAGGYRYNLSIGRGSRTILGLQFPVMLDHGDSGAPWFYTDATGRYLAGISQNANGNDVTMATVAGATSLAPSARGGEWVRAVLGL